MFYKIGSTNAFSGSGTGVFEGIGSTKVNGSTGVNTESISGILESDVIEKKLKQKAFEQERLLDLVKKMLKLPYLCCV